MAKFKSPKGLSVYQRTNGVVIDGIYAFIDGTRFELKKQHRNNGSWQADHDAYRHLTPENLVKWSDEE